MATLVLRAACAIATLCLACAPALAQEIQEAEAAFGILPACVSTGAFRSLHARSQSWRLPPQ